MFASRGSHSHICCSLGCGCQSKYLTLHFSTWPFDCTKIDCLTLWPQQVLQWLVMQHSWIYSLTPWWATWPLDPCLQCLLIPDFILTTAKVVNKGMYMEVTILVSWEASLLVACYSIQLFNSGAHRFVWCSYANKDNPQGSTLEHLLQNWTSENNHCCHRWFYSTYFAHPKPCRPGRVESKGLAVVV